MPRVAILALLLYSHGSIFIDIEIRLRFINRLCYHTCKIIQFKKHHNMHGTGGAFILILYMSHVATL